MHVRNDLWKNKKYIQHPCCISFDESWAKAFYRYTLMSLHLFLLKVRKHTHCCLQYPDQALGQSLCVYQDLEGCLGQIPLHFHYNPERPQLPLQPEGERRVTDWNRQLQIFGSPSTKSALRKHHHLQIHVSRLLPLQSRTDSFHSPSVVFSHC